jgi:hypothetical protein
MGRRLRYLVLFTFFVCSISLSAQQYRLLNYRLHFSLSPSVSTGAQFENGSTVAATPNITGTHYLYPLFSLLWGFPNPQFTARQNFGRKFNYSLFFELILSRQHSVNTGFEIGARGYGIKSDQSDDFIIMYRNISMPFFYTHTSRVGNYWRWRKHAGFAINRASSVPQLIEDVIEIKKSPMFYPTVFVGTEIAYLQSKGPFAYSVEYHQGFKNVIDHRYFALDNKQGLRIFSNGSHFRLNIKWFFAAGSFKVKRKEKKIDEPYIYNPFASIPYRIKKLPKQVIVKDSVIKLCFRDDQTVDGDSILVELNGKEIARTISLDRTEACYTIHLNKTKGNNLVIHAINLGRIPPNTYEVVYYDGDYRGKLRLKSDLENSSSVNIVVKPQHKRE